MNNKADQIMKVLKIAIEVLAVVLAVSGHIDRWRKGA